MTVLMGYITNIKSGVNDAGTSSRPNQNLLFRSKFVAEPTLTHQCSVPNCERKVLSRGYCSGCYQRLRKSGELPRRTPLYTLPCSIFGCGNKQSYRGMCEKHVQRFRKYGDANFVWNDHGKGDTPELRFWSRVKITADPNRCWEWSGSKTHRGYGWVKWQGKNSSAHRVSFFLANGRFPMPGNVVRHICDTPPCCNPNHLIEGSAMDNTLDKLRRGRVKRGSATHKSRLTEADIPVIRRRIEAGDTVVSISRDFKVARSTIQAIRDRRTWTHVKENEKR